MAYTGKSFNDRIKEIGFILLLVLLFCLIVYELKYFLSSLLGAFTLYMILRKPYKNLLAKGWKNIWAVTVLIVSVFLIISVVGGIITGAVYFKLKSFNSGIIMDNLQLLHNEINERWGYNIFSEEIIVKGINQIGSFLPALLSATGNVVANVVMMIFILIFMLKDSAYFEEGIENFLPVSKDSIDLLKKETNNMVISNAIGVPMIMLVQSSVAALAYWVTGAGDPIIWGLLTGFCGLIPVVGTAAVWIPLSANLLMGNHIWQGLALIVWGACVVSSIDNVFRIFFLNKYANVHPITALFGVIVGINLFGFWGIIFGPLVISGFLLLVKIFHYEFLANR
ncbi:MAG: AI-2E family transporter [Dysgonamonadaceae bacterium]|jgi:predicted PurR-regulated permease PerM|nr:AI-2E family transporter [Dysgonamonadaceae bacterium]